MGLDQARGHDPVRTATRERRPAAQSRNGCPARRDRCDPRRARRYRRGSRRAMRDAGPNATPLPTAVRRVPSGRSRSVARAGPAIPCMRGQDRKFSRHQRRRAREPRARLLARARARDSAPSRNPSADPRTTRGARPPPRAGRPGRSRGSWMLRKAVITRHSAQAAEPRRLDHDPREPRIDRQPRHRRPSRVMRRSPSTADELREEPIAVVEQPSVRSIDERELVGVHRARAPPSAGSGSRDWCAWISGSV